MTLKSDSKVTLEPKPIKEKIRRFQKNYKDKHDIVCLWERQNTFGVVMTAVIFLVIQSSIKIRERIAVRHAEVQISLDQNSKEISIIVTDVVIKTGRENLYIIYTLELYKEDREL